MPENGTRQPLDEGAGHDSEPSGEGAAADTTDRAADRAADPRGDHREQVSDHSLEEAVHEIEELEHEYRPPAAGTLTNILTAAAIVVLGGAALVGSAALGLGTAGKPGPGTWPMLVSGVLVVLGVALLVIVRRTHDAEKFSRGSWLVLAGLATMVGFVVVIEVVGFEIPAALLCFVWLRFLGREGRRVSVITSVAVVVGFYLVFVAALDVPIPHLF